MGQEQCSHCIRTQRCEASEAEAADGVKNVEEIGELEMDEQTINTMDAVSVVQATDRAGRSLPETSPEVGSSAPIGSTNVAVADEVADAERPAKIPSRKAPAEISITSPSGELIGRAKLGVSSDTGTNSNVSGAKNNAVTFTPDAKDNVTSASSDKARMWTPSDSNSNNWTPSNSKSESSARSATAQALCHSSKCEWWMQGAEEDLKAPLGLFETWVGNPVELPTTERTPLMQRGVFSPIRSYCAGKRIRYQWNGFDLDLSYVTNRIIAMGFPGQGSQAVFRNPHSSVSTFFGSFHQNRYRIYNLCAEKKHQLNGFPEQTVSFPIADHCPPPFSTIVSFCEDVKSWLEAEAENVAAIHCKAGKGRTGTMICALLIYAGAVSSAYDALRWYECVRGGLRAGVTIPAQIRSVAMFERWMKTKCIGLRCDPLESAHKHRLESIRVGPLQGSFVAAGNNPPPNLIVRVGLATRADNDLHRVTHWFPDVAVCAETDHILHVSLADDGPIWRENDGVLLVRVLQPGCCAAKIKFRVWWHYPFLQSGVGETNILDVAKSWLDGLQKDLGKNKKTPDDFRLSAVFRDVEGESTFKADDPDGSQ